MDKDYNKPDQNSIRNTVNDLEEKKLLLPEFQRNFTWSMEQTIDLFDSIARGIFIGAFILSKPKFDLSCREIDTRPRKGKGSRAKLEEHHLRKHEFDHNDTYVLLDGQQRVTSLYRTLKGIDPIYFVLKSPSKLPPTSKEDLELLDIIDGFSTKIKSDKICIGVHEIFQINNKWREKRIRTEVFDPAWNQLKDSEEYDEKDKEKYFEIILEIKSLFHSIVEDKTLLSVFLLDMDLEKFCLFFERSNSKGVTLNFIDIITAKIYIGFNLRKQIEKIKDEKSFKVDNPLIESFVRFISYIEKGKVDKKTILDSLDHNHFTSNWENVVNLFERTINYLTTQKLLIDYSWLRYRTMYIPIMNYLKHLPHQDFTQQSKEQLEFFKFWYFSSLLNTRYGGGMVGSTNDIIVEDCKILESLAKGEEIDKSLIKRFKFEFDEDDLYDLSSKGAVFTGIMMLINHELELKDWSNNGNLNSAEKLNIHHIFPKKYIESTYSKESFEQENVNSILNKAIINKLPNQKYGKKPPSKYLNEKPIESNTSIIESLQSHAIPNAKKLKNGEYDNDFRAFLEDRYLVIKDLIDTKIITYQEKLIDSKT